MLLKKVLEHKKFPLELKGGFTKEADLLIAHKRKCSFASKNFFEQLTGDFLIAGCTECSNSRMVLILSEIIAEIESAFLIDAYEYDVSYSRIHSDPAWQWPRVLLKGKKLTYVDILQRKLLEEESEVFSKLNLSKNEVTSRLALVLSDVIYQFAKDFYLEHEMGYSTYFKLNTKQYLCIVPIIMLATIYSESSPVKRQVPLMLYEDNRFNGINPLYALTYLTEEDIKKIKGLRRKPNTAELLDFKISTPVSKILAAENEDGMKLCLEILLSQTSNLKSFDDVFETIATLK